MTPRGCRACAGPQRVALPSLSSDKPLPSTPRVLQTRLSLISSLSSNLSPLTYGAALGQASGCQYRNLIHPASARSCPASAWSCRQRPENPQGHRGIRLEVPRPYGQFKPENLDRPCCSPHRGHASRPRGSEMLLWMDTEDPMLSQVTQMARAAGEAGTAQPRGSRSQPAAQECHLQGYSKPSAPPLFWVFLPLSSGIPTTQSP